MSGEIINITRKVDHVLINGGSLDFTYNKIRVNISKSVSYSDHIIIKLHYIGEDSHDMNDVNNSLRQCIGLELRDLRLNSIYQSEHGMPNVYWCGIYRVKYFGEDDEW